MIPYNNCYPPDQNLF